MRSATPRKDVCASAFPPRLRSKERRRDLHSVPVEESFSEIELSDWDVFLEEEESRPPRERRILRNFKRVARGRFEAQQNKQRPGDEEVEGSKALERFVYTEDKKNWGRDVKGLRRSKRLNRGQLVSVSSR